MDRLAELNEQLKDGGCYGLSEREELEIRTEIIDLQAVEIERLKKDNERFIKVNIEVAYMNADYLIAIERLEREKEWLWERVKTLGFTEEDLQQALKE